MHLPKIFVLAATLLVAAIASCTKDKNEAPKFDESNKKKITEVMLAGTSVKAALYSRYDSLFVGYNPLYIRLTDTQTNTGITNADIALLPMMDMGAMQHACPVEQPVYTSSEQAYTGAAAFIMAGDMGWTLTLTTTLNGNTYTNTIPLAVKATPATIKLIATIKNQDGVPYYVVLVHPQTPEQKTGLNDLEIGIYKRNTMSDFPSVAGMTVSFEPTMPSMGHSSPNNVNPVFTAKGHYQGKVNFTMTGDWQLDFALSGDGSTFENHAILNLVF
jgi:hypothetical protein